MQLFDSSVTLRSTKTLCKQAAAQTPMCPLILHCSSVCVCCVCVVNWHAHVCTNTHVHARLTPRYTPSLLRCCRSGRCCREASALFGPTSEQRGPVL